MSMARASSVLLPGDSVTDALQLVVPEAVAQLPLLTRYCT